MTITTKKQNTMNFQQALLWMAFTAMIGIFAYIFYGVIKNERDDNDKGERDPKSKKPKHRTPAATPRCPIAKISQGPAIIISPISNIRGGEWKW
jgi:hypothetical protein